MFNSSLKGISKIRIEEYFTKRGIEIDDFSNDELENLLFNTEIMVESNSKKCISLAGMLFFSKKPSLWLKNAGVQLVRFNGNDVTDEIIDRKNLEGNLPDIIDKTLDFVNIYNKISEKF